MIKSEDKTSKTTDNIKIFHGYCRYRSVDTSLCCNGKFDNECTVLSDRLNEIFKNTDLRSFLEFDRVLITCPDKNAKGSRLIRQFFFPPEDESDTQKEPGRLLELTGQLTSPSVKFKGKPVIILHEKALEKDEILCTTVIHELIHAKDFATRDKFSNLLYFSPISTVLALLFKMPIFIGFVCLWTLLGLFAKSLFPNLLGLLLDTIYLLIGPLVVLLIVLEYLLEIRTEYRTYQFLRSQKLQFEVQGSFPYMFKGVVYILVGIITILIIIIAAVISDPYIRYFSKIYL